MLFKGKYLGLGTTIQCSNEIFNLCLTGKSFYRKYILWLMKIVNESWNLKTDI